MFSTVCWLTNFSDAVSATASSAGAGGGIMNSRRWGNARTQRRQFPVRVLYCTSPHVLQRITSRSISSVFISSLFNCADTGAPCCRIFRRADRRGTSERSHGGRQLLARWEYRVNAIFLSRVFLYF